MLMNKTTIEAIIYIYPESRPNKNTNKQKNNFFKMTILATAKEKKVYS